jgi:UDP-glucose 4-epimerase
MAHIIGYKKRPVHMAARKGELSRSFLNIKKASQKLGWKPNLSLYKGLNNTIQYFREN